MKVNGQVYEQRETVLSSEVARGRALASPGAMRARCGTVRQLEANADVPLPVVWVRLVLVAVPVA